MKFRKMRMRSDCKILALALGMVSVSVFAVDNVDLENETNRIKKELSQIRLERQRVVEDMAKDKKEYSEYLLRTEARKNDCMKETDSIKHRTALTVQKRDSLASLINASQIKRKQYELLQESFRQSVVDACVRLSALVKKMPPNVSNQGIGAITFLMNDCRLKSIDNIEALHRLMQIIQNLEEAGASIQVGQETSVVPEIRNASLLRIGAIFEAITDDEGKVCAFWSGVDSLGHEHWDVIRDPFVASLIIKAISVRQGKALPSFIDLPYGGPAVKEATK